MSVSEPSGDLNNTQRENSHSRLHLIYFLLAGFDLLTVGLSLLVLTMVGDIYTESVRTNQQWAQRLADYRELMALASAANAPGHDLFTSRDADRESMRLEAAVRLFQQTLLQCQQDVSANVPEPERSELSDVLEAIDVANEEILTETRGLLSAFRDRQLDEAGKWMASVNQSHSKMHAALADLGERVSVIQESQFEKQMAQAASLERLELVVIVLIVAMVVGITVYGRKLAKRMIASENQIRQLNAELEDRVRDRTAELTAANKTLFEREQRLHAIFDMAFCAIVTFDEHGVVESYNQAGQRVFGYRSNEVIGQNIQMLVAEETPRDVTKDLVDLLSTTRHVGRAQEMTGVRKDGTTFPMNLSITRVELPDRKLYTGIINDVTDEKRALQAERLASIGQMITAITHESRNALQRIQAGLDILQFEVEAGSEAREDLDKITSATDDLSHLFDEIRSYAAPIKLEPFPCNLADLWRKAWTNMASARDGPQAHLHEEINGVNLVCTLDAFRIEQVFRNLIENSLSACPDPVEIAIQCEDVRLNGAPAVCVSVRDNGPGLTDEQKKRIFEAFFTTKAKGTGLGMAIALRIVGAHRGTILAGNGHRGGAEFLITLPRNES
jgi:PAS domain S-box-containing protein